MASSHQVSFYLFINKSIIKTCRNTIEYRKSPFAQTVDEMYKTDGVSLFHRSHMPIENIH